jgi:signal transduction histidine kinase
MYVFERDIERRVVSELQNHMLQLVGAVRADANGEIKLARPLADPRFDRPLGGLYWQIDSEGVDVARSRSLWDQKLEVPTPPKEEQEAHLHSLTAPDGAELYSLERFVLVDVNGVLKPFVVTVGIDRREIREAVSSFAFDLALALAVLAAALLLASWIQVSVGLRPLQLLRDKLATIRAGRQSRLTGQFPDEVEPLVDDLNALLVSREEQLARARHRAGDLAHGLKTPLTVLSAIAGDVKSAGLEKEARDIELQTEHMRSHVERELVRARLASGRATALTPLAPAVDRLVETMIRAPGGDGISWTKDVPISAEVPIDSDDLTELLGNVLDNARKWARSAVRIRFADGALSVADDGPGIPEHQRDSVIERGVRLDQRVAGSGMGLAIVRDIGEVYGLALTLGRSEFGGLEVKIGLTREKPA